MFENGQEWLGMSGHGCKWQEQLLIAVNGFKNNSCKWLEMTVNDWNMREIVGNGLTWQEIALNALT